MIDPAPASADDCEDLRLILRIVIEHADEVEAQLAAEVQRRAVAERALRASLAELSRLCILDDLTQIANRRRFDQYLDECWSRLQRQSVPLTLLLCDIDYFKGYNDALGHQQGDRCLRQVAQTIAAQAARAGDLTARYGGEEFAVILPDDEGPVGQVVAERIRQAVEDLAIDHPGSPTGRVTVSIGVASMVTDRSCEPRNLVALADAALYRAKGEGRNRVALS